MPFRTVTIILSILVALWTGSNTAYITETPAPSASASVLTPRPPEAATSSYFIPLNSVKLIYCPSIDNPGQGHVGTGWLINTNTFVTAHHVIAGSVPGTCTIDGKRLTVLHDSPDLDFSVLSVGSGTMERIPYSCAGFETGKDYFIIGFARGTDFAVTKVVATPFYQNSRDTETTQKFTHVRLLHGFAVGGMSGGPIVDMDGKVVGIINAGAMDGTPRTLSRELRDTYICEAEVARENAAAAEAERQRPTKKKKPRLKFPG